jgi:hypothetical protein
MPLEPITSDRLAKPVGPFSPAVRDGDRVYTSGQVAQDPATKQYLYLRTGQWSKPQASLQYRKVSPTSDDESVGLLAKQGAFIGLALLGWLIPPVDGLSRLFALFQYHREVSLQRRWLGQRHSDYNVGLQMRESRPAIILKKQTNSWKMSTAVRVLISL